MIKKSFVETKKIFCDLTMGDWRHYRGTNIEELESVDHHVKKAIQYAKKAEQFQKDAQNMAQNGDVSWSN